MRSVCLCQNKAVSVADAITMRAYAVLRRGMFFIGVYEDESQIEW